MIAGPSATTPTRYTAPSPYGLITADGRRAGFCWGGKLRCPDGHDMKPREPVLTEAVATCRHKDRQDAPPCGLRVYARRVGEGALFVVEITDALVRAIHHEDGRIFLETLSILRCVLPGVRDLDLARGIESLPPVLGES